MLLLLELELVVAVKLFSESTVDDVVVVLFVMFEVVSKSSSLLDVVVVVVDPVAVDDEGATRAAAVALSIEPFAVFIRQSNVFFPTVIALPFS